MTRSPHFGASKWRVVHSDYDFAEKVAFNTYCKMTDERKGSKNGKELEHYLTIMSEKILLWMIDIQDAENLKNS